MGDSEKLSSVQFINKVVESKKQNKFDSVQTATYIFEIVMEHSGQKCSHCSSILNAVKDRMIQEEKEGADQ